MPAPVLRRRPCLARTSVRGGACCSYVKPGAVKSSGPPAAPHIVRCDPAPCVAEQQAPNHTPQRLLAAQLAGSIVALQCLCARHTLADRPSLGLLGRGFGLGDFRPLFVWRLFAILLVSTCLSVLRSLLSTCAQCMGAELMCCPMPRWDKKQRGPCSPACHIADTGTASQLGASPLPAPAPADTIPCGLNLQGHRAQHLDGMQTCGAPGPLRRLHFAGRRAMHQADSSN